MCYNFEVRKFMQPTEASVSLPTPVIILIVFGIIVGIALLGFLVFKLFIEKLRLRKQIRELDQRFQYLHALLIGQDAQYVKRLEIISRSNLLYVEIHTKFLKRFKEVRDKHDAHVQSTINHLKDLCDDKKYKMLKSAIAEGKDAISSYENEVNSLNNDLLAVVRPEEECRQASLSLKERLRAIKQDYYSKQSDLQMMNSSFEEIFEYIDNLFSEFEENIERAQYDDAKAILPKIDKILLEMSNAMSELPNLCAMVISYIPDKIVSLENAYEIMQQDDYPLHHLCVSSSIKEMKTRIGQLTQRIKRFDLRGVGNELDDMVSRIDEYFVLFDEEKQARTTFEENNEKTYQVVNTIEKRFIKLCNTIPEVDKIYTINESHKMLINSIQTNINKLGALKRSLDTFIHSATKQPYSLLVNKMKEIEDASKTVINSLDDFDKYLASLKVSSEKAYSLLPSYYLKGRDAEKMLRDIDVEKVTLKYQEKIDHFYELLEETNKLLHSSPIDVDKVNDCVKELHDINNELFDDGALKQDYNMMLLAKNGILYANRDRYRLSDIDALIKQAEGLFDNGDFENSYVVAGDALKKIQAVNHESK